jgi:PBP1b-binding outer membrane lipoprotein LpoB
MRVLAIAALALLLAGCNGDRTKQGTDTRQPQSWWPLHTHDAL